ncbi:retropepsin-like aspartic protease [Kamptonema formosum]|uniref:retropepsin-like aspartic protease n=1 Tax=Kamptonema formosum TaxID=331992 RepID=UPI00035C12F2|nr:retropepsin-like aspartic protease [Oscillatoria sp. PCC 10802]
MSAQRIYRCSRYGNLLLVQAAAGGRDGSVREVRLLVDTGSSYTLLRVSVLEALGCDLQNPLRRLTTLTGGGTVAAPVVAVPWFSCLGHHVDNFPMLAYTLPATTFADGLVGMDFLTRCQAVIYIREGEIRCPQSP